MALERRDGPVLVRSIKATKAAGMITVGFMQQCLRPITSNAAMRKVFMQGDDKFGPIYDVRIAFVIMTQIAYDRFGLSIGVEFPESWRPRIIVCEFCDGDPIPQEVRGLYEDAEVFYHKSWTGGAQQPKMTSPGMGGQRIMCHKGLPIYRDTHLVIGEVYRQDILKPHDSEVYA